MELFIGTVDASAEAAAFPDPDTPATNVGDTTAPVIADYKRPTAVQSDYLDTAINPAPWPTRDSPPEPRGGRPLLGHERKVFLTAPTR
ncbi:hypothetical protein [Plantactinospora sp. KBS50]|uniref:hypothetical protein n=1 Tax=Plantactinospora sp. KBS50 TaxID=2024580 RepID=UPI0018DF05BD|nr:hypothetical protein [Plantactinospora sp. KBS50]